MQLRSIPSLLALSTFCVTTALAQERPVRCLTPSHDPAFITPEEPGDCGYRFTNPKASFARTFIFRIPVVFHVISNSSGSGNLTVQQVQEQIEILNEDFRATPGSNGAPGVDCGIEFYIADTDPQGNPATGITFSQNNTWYNDGGGYWNSLAWDTNRYLNIYSNGGGGALGYVPNLPQGGIVGQNSDRVVVLWSTVGRNGSYGPPFNLGRTVTHEVGHYLGLWHTFDGGCGGGNCYQSGDYICDTNGESSPNFGCGNRSTCGSPDPIHNYMDYSDDACMWEFTEEQARRMRCTLEFWRGFLASRCAVASAVSRNAGNNPMSYTAEAPLLGDTWDLALDVSSTGHNMGMIFGFTGSSNIPMSNGYNVLFDPASTLLISLPVGNGPTVNYSVPLPNDTSFCGATVYTQGVHVGGAPDYALSNAQDVTFGR